MLSFSEFISGGGALGMGVLGGVALCLLLAGTYFVTMGAWLFTTCPPAKDPSDLGITVLCGVGITGMGAGLLLLAAHVGRTYVVPHLMPLGAQAVVLGLILVAIAFLAMVSTSKLFPLSTKAELPISIVGASGIMCVLGGVGVLARALLF